MQQLFVLTQTDGTDKKVTVCCNKTVLKHTSVVKYKMPSKLNFLICRLEEVENHCGPQDIPDFSPLIIFCMDLWNIHLYNTKIYIFC